MEIVFEKLHVRLKFPDDMGVILKKQKCEGHRKYSPAYFEEVILCHKLDDT
jgi:hypothetical protein